MKMSSLRITLFLALFAATTTQWAHGHGMHIFAAMESGVVRGTVTYSDDKPAIHIPVTISDPSSVVVHELETDDAGSFVFTPRALGTHTIVAQGSDGHREETTIEVDAIFRTSPSSNANTQQLVEDAVGRQIVPLLEKIDSLERQTRMRDIIGGIGYILGVMGLIVFFRSAKGSAS